MIQYNPKTWFALIFHAYSRQVMRKLRPAMIFMVVFTALLCYFILDYLGVPRNEFQGTSVVHSLLGIVLGLFLVFRTNSAYDRWWEGRRLWGALVNSTRNLAIKLNAFLPQEDHETREWFGRMIPNFVFATKEHLRFGVQFAELTFATEQEQDELKANQHRPNRISALMYERINDLYRRQLISGEQYRMLDREASEFVDILGACERIKNTPIPYSYTMYIKKFIFVYTLTLPFGLLATFGYFSIATVLLITYILLSVELIAEEIEDPFGKDRNDLPTDDLSVRIRDNVREILRLGALRKREAWQ